MASDKYWKTRPDGVNPKDYEVAQWTNARIGWEFLRRNSEYQQVCHRAVELSEGQKRLAFVRKRGRDWALATLLPYSRDWREVREKLRIRFFGESYVDPEEYDEIELTEMGRTAYFEINLKVARESDKLLNRQVGEIASKARQLLAELRTREHVTTTSLGRVNRKNDPALTRYLRVLDMDSAGTKPKRISELLYEKDGDQPLAINDIYKRLSPDRAAAKRLAEGEYKKFWLAEIESKK